MPNAENSGAVAGSNSKWCAICCCGLMLVAAAASSAFAQDVTPNSTPMTPTPTTEEQPAVSLATPAPTPDDKPYPIDLPTALRLAHVQALDIQIASQQSRAAGAQLQGAWALWLPTVISGAEYVYHTGPLQTTDGTVENANRDSLYAGIAPLVTMTLTDAIFSPLAAQQTARAQRANIRTATNDTLTSVALGYFDAQEARRRVGGCPRRAQKGPGAGGQGRFHRSFTGAGG